MPQCPVIIKLLHINRLKPDDHGDSRPAFLYGTFSTPDLAAPIDNSGRYTEVEYNITPLSGSNAIKFGSFAFKIVFTSTTARKVPSCKDFRAIASI